MVVPQGVDRGQGGLLIWAGPSICQWEHVGSKGRWVEYVSWWVVAACHHFTPLTSGGVAAAHTTPDASGCFPYELGEMAYIVQAINCLHLVKRCGG